MTGRSMALAALLMTQWGCRESPPDPLRLTGKLDGHAIVLHWNAGAPAISRARSGRLTIAGGPRRIEKPLSVEDLNRGSLTYSPATSDVSITLEVMAKNGIASKESLRVVDSPDTSAASEPQAERMKEAIPARPPGFPLPPRGVR